MMSSLHGIRALTNSLGDTLGENTAQPRETEQQRVGGKRTSTVTSLQEIPTKNNNNNNNTFLICMGARTRDSYLWRFVL